MAPPVRPVEIPAATEEQRNTMRTVLSSYIDKSLYDAFWKSVESTAPPGRQQWVKTWGTFLIDRAAYEAALWRSAKQSWSESRPVRLPELDKLALRFRRQYTPYMGAASELAYLLEDTDGILKAAAMNMPYYRSRGYTHALGANVFDNHLSQAANAMARVHLLLAPAWVTPNVDVTYRNEGVRISSPYFFAEDVIHGFTGDPTQSQIKPVTMYDLTTVFDDAAHASITVAPYVEGTEDDILKRFKITYRLVNAPAEPVEIGRWQDYKSARTCFIRPKRVPECIRIVLNHHTHMLYSFFVYSSKSESNAAARLDELEKAIHML